MKKWICSILLSALVAFMFWCGGVEIERGMDLGFALLITILVGLFSLTCPFWDNK